MHPNTSDESKDERSNPTRANDERGGDHHEQGEELGSHVLLPRKAASNTYGGSNDHWMIMVMRPMVPLASETLRVAERLR